LLNQLHAQAGAVLGSGAAAAPLTFGDVPAEYAAALERCALFDQTSRGMVIVRGAEAAAFLHRLLANTVRGLASGQGNRNLLLSSKGKVLFDFDLSVEGESIELSTTPGSAERLVAALELYHFSEKVEFEDASERTAPLALAGPAAGEVVRAALGIEPPSGDHQSARGTLEGRAVKVVALPVAGSTGMRVDAGPELAHALWRKLAAAGARPAGLVAYDSLRVEAGVAEPGVDIDENVYPQEARLEAGFSLEKGCYVGQEVVAKIDTYGGLNKRLCALRVSHDDPVPRGTKLAREEDGEWREVGLATSWAYSFALDTGLVLAYVKRRHQQPGTELRLEPGPATATVVELPVRAGVAARA
jgi:folate-binding protein YgfZ